MVKCERFVIGYDAINRKINTFPDESIYVFHPIIYDRVNRRKIVSIDVGDDEINDEIAERVLTMLNIKFINKRNDCK